MTHQPPARTRRRPAGPPKPRRDPSRCYCQPVKVFTTKDGKVTAIELRHVDPCRVPAKPLDVAEWEASR